MGIHWTDVPKLRINNMDNKRIYILNKGEGWIHVQTKWIKAIEMYGLEGLSN
jgi:hypothetical protein